MSLAQVPTFFAGALLSQAALHLDLTPIPSHSSMPSLFGHGMEEWDGIRQSTFELPPHLLLIKKLLIEGLITRRFPLKHRRMAVRTAKDKGCGAIKVILDFGLET